MIIISLLWVSCTSKEEKKYPIANRYTAEAISTDNFETPTVALQEMKAGYQRYLNGQFHHVHFKRVTANEAPDVSIPAVAIVSCTELKIPEDILFDTEKQNLLLLKTEAGQVNKQIIERLSQGGSGIKLLLLLQHTQCHFLQQAAASQLPTDSLIIHRQQANKQILFAGNSVLDSLTRQNLLLVRSVTYNDSTNELSFEQ